jgi:galactose mutarotase-like enzyme
MNTRLITIRHKQKAAQVYPEQGFQLYGFEEEVRGQRIQVIDAPSDGIEPADRRFGNPILFPNPSTCWGPSGEDSWDHGARKLFMPFHGFARNSYWNIVRVEPHLISAELRPCSSLKNIFPFDFSLRCTYELNDSGLILKAEVQNTGKEAFPYALGFHPYIRTPLGKEGTISDCAIQLPEGTEVSSKDGWKTFSSGPSPSRIVRASDSLVGSILLADTGTRFVEVYDSANRNRVRVTFETNELKAPCWVIWSATPDSPYVCIEPWTSPPNALNRPTALHCSPGATHSFQMTLSLRKD